MYYFHEPFHFIAIAVADIGLQQHYRQLGQTVKEASRAEYKSWVESHSVEEIAIANAARKSLRRRQPSAKGHISKWPEIVDERLVKRNVNPYTLYFVNRQASGEFGDAPITERAKIIAKDWHALDASEKQVRLPSPRVSHPRLGKVP